jgi:anti-sigma factor RsiW
MRHREHPRIAKAIDAWVDHELDDATARRVARHVRDCRDCSAAVETTRLVKRSLHRQRDCEPRHLATARLARFAQQLSGT